MGAGSNTAALIGEFYAERNREYPLEIPVLSLGRALANGLRIPDERVAAHHARIERDGSRYVLEVMAGAGRTWLNGAELRSGERRVLRDGDRIGLADLEFRFVRRARAEALGRLRVVGGVHCGKVFRIERFEARIGRATDNDVQFPDRSVSRHHCRIVQRGSAWWIEDLKSTNGTLLRGTPVLAPERLTDGDEVVAGHSRFVFHEPEKPRPSPRTEPTQPHD